jgi:hypothetical protein
MSAQSLATTPPLPTRRPLQSLAVAPPVARPPIQSRIGPRTPPAHQKSGSKWNKQANTQASKGEKYPGPSFSPIIRTGQ